MTETKLLAAPPNAPDAARGAAPPAASSPRPEIGWNAFEVWRKRVFVAKPSGYKTGRGNT